jgi:hypothetical protein
LAPGNEHSKEIAHQAPGREAHSFDNLAMELANGSPTRGQALKYMGMAFLGGLAALVGISAFADDANAKRRRKKKKKKKKSPGFRSICPGQLPCPVGFIGVGGCCPPGFPVCCPASVGGGCCPAGTTICTVSGLCL